MRIKLKTFRGSQNLKQKGMAEKIGVSLRGYQAVELGERNGNIEFWEKLKNAFNLDWNTVGELMKDE